MLLKHDLNLLVKVNRKTDCLSIDVYTPFRHMLGSVKWHGCYFSGTQTDKHLPEKEAIFYFNYQESVHLSAER